MLQRITRYDGSGRTNLPPTEFAYSPAPNSLYGWQNAAEDVPVAFLTKTSTGDGRDTDDHGVQIEDINRDGLPDLVKGFRSDCGGDPIREVYFNGRGRWVLQEGQFASWELKEDFVVRSCGTEIQEEYDNGLRLLDVNADSLPDLVRSVQFDGGPVTTTVWVNTGNTWDGPWPGWSIPLAFVNLTHRSIVGIQSEDLGVRFGDVNGDGLADMIKSRDTSSRGCNEVDHRIYLHNGNNGWTNTRSSGWKVPATFVHHYCGGESVDLGARMLDVNGDGLADLVQSVTWDGVTQKHLWLGMGYADPQGNVWKEVGDWDIPEIFTIAESSNDDSDDLGVRFGDVNGDGRVDLLVAREWEGTTPSCDTGIATCQRVYLHRAGKGWAYHPTWSGLFPPNMFFVEHRQLAEDYDDGVRVGDFDGNGTVDLVKSMDGFRGGPYERRMNTGTFSDLMVGRSNGIGGSATLTYGSSTDYDNRLAPISFSTGSLGWVIPVVKQMTVSDGQAGTGHNFLTTYLYAGGFYHSGQREFRGFQTVRTDLPGGRAFLEQTFLQERDLDVVPLVGSPLTETLRRSSDRAIFSVARYTYEWRWLPSDTYHQSLRGLDRELWDWSGSVQKTTSTTYILSVTGGITPYIDLKRVTEFGEPGPSTSDDELSTTEEYINNTDAWIIGRVKRSYTASPAATLTPLTQTWMYYDEAPWGQVGAHGDLTRIELWSGNPTDGLGGNGNRNSRLRYDGAGDALGHVVSSLDAENHEIRFDYGLIDLTKTFLDRTRVTTSDGVDSVEHVTSYAHDARSGAVTSVITPGDGTFSAKYDEFGRLVKSWTPNDSEDRPTACYQYQLASRPVVVSAFAREKSGLGEGCGPDGMLGAASFMDGLGRIVQSQKEGYEMGQVLVRNAVTFGAEGKIASVNHPFSGSGAVSTYAAPPADVPKVIFEYDPVGRSITVTSPASPVNRVQRTFYRGWTTEVRDPEGIKTETDTDAFGRVRERRTFFKPIQGEGLYAWVTHTYDRLGRLRYITPNSNENARIEYLYNAFGDLLESIDPDAGRRSYEYYKDGLIHRVEDAAGAFSSHTYDALHRLQRLESSDGSVARYVYDEPAGRPSGQRPLGHLTSIVDQSTGIAQQLEYDAIGQAMRKRETVEGTTREIVRTLDALGRVETLTYPHGAPVTYQYGPGGLVNAVPGFATGIAYTASGSLDFVRYANGLEIDHEEDPRTLDLRRIAACFQCGEAGQAKVVDSTFEYNLSGYVERMTDLVGTATQEFTLDHAYRLRTAGSPSSYGTLDFEHDTYGNLMRKGLASFTLDPAHPHQVATSSNGTRFAYDLNGLLRTALDQDDLGRTHTYNALHRLTGFNDTKVNKSVQNIYNPEGERVLRSEIAGSEQTVTVFSSNLYEETNSQYKKFVYLGSQRIAEVQGEIGTGDQSTYFYVGDHLGSLNVVTNQAGQVVHRMEYIPYGGISSVQGDNFTASFMYAGARLDKESGLYDFGARSYDPTLGRFLTIDPVLSDPLDFMDLNPYGYGLGNPSTFVDLGGMSSDVNCGYGVTCHHVGGGVKDDDRAIPETTVGLSFSFSLNGFSLGDFLPSININIGSPDLSVDGSNYMLSVRNLTSTCVGNTDCAYAVQSAAITEEFEQNRAFIAAGEASAAATDISNMLLVAELGPDPSYNPFVFIAQTGFAGPGGYTQVVGRDPLRAGLENLVLSGGLVAGSSILSAGLSPAAGALISRTSILNLEAASLLSAGDAAAFGGSIHTMILQRSVEGLRYSGGSSPAAGRWLTTRQSLTRMTATGARPSGYLNLPPGNAGAGPNRWRIPAGTRVFVGRVAGGGPGATQVLIRDPNVLISVSP